MGEGRSHLGNNRVEALRSSLSLPLSRSASRYSGQPMAAQQSGKKQTIPLQLFSFNLNTSAEATEAFDIHRNDDCFSCWVFSVRYIIRCCIYKRYRKPLVETRPRIKPAISVVLCVVMQHGGSCCHPHCSASVELCCRRRPSLPHLATCSAHSPGAHVPRRPRSLSWRWLLGLPLISSSSLRRRP